jgi:hypothetical protein
MMGFLREGVGERREGAEKRRSREAKKPEGEKERRREGGKPEGRACDEAAGGLIVGDVGTRPHPGPLPADWARE